MEPTSTMTNCYASDDVCWTTGFDPSDEQDIQLGVNIGIVNSYTVIIGINQKTGKQVYYRSFCPGSMAYYHDVINAIKVACQVFPKSICVVDVTTHGEMTKLMRETHGVTIYPVFWNKKDQSVLLHMLEIVKPSLDLFDMAKSGADVNSVNNALVCAIKYIPTPELTKKTLEQRFSDLEDQVEALASCTAKDTNTSYALGKSLDVREYVASKPYLLLEDQNNPAFATIRMDEAAVRHTFALIRSVEFWQAETKEARDRVGDLSRQLGNTEQKVDDLNKKLKHAASDIDQLKDSFQEAATDLEEARTCNAKLLACIADVGNRQ
jgi:hypothetical protein